MLVELLSFVILVSSINIQIISEFDTPTDTGLNTELENIGTGATLERDDFNYRKECTIQGSNGAGTGYQMRFVVHYGTGTDGSPTAEDVYLNGHCRRISRMSDSLMLLQVSLPLIIGLNLL